MAQTSLLISKDKDDTQRDNNTSMTYAHNSRSGLGSPLNVHSDPASADPSASPGGGVKRFDPARSVPPVKVHGDRHLCPEITHETEFKKSAT